MSLPGNGYGDALGDEEDGQDEELEVGPAEMEMISKQLDEEKGKLDATMKDLDDSLGSEMDLLTQLRKDIEAFKQATSDSSTSNHRNSSLITVAPRTSLTPRISLKPKITDAPWMSQDNALLRRRGSMSSLESLSREKLDGTQRRASTTDSHALNRMEIAADGFESDEDFQKWKRGLAARSLSALPGLGGSVSAAAGERKPSLVPDLSILAIGGDPRRASVSIEGMDNDIRFEVESRRSSVYSDFSRRTSMAPEAMSEEMRTMKREERQLKIEYQQIVNATREEIKRHDELTLLIETSRNHLSVQHRSVRTTKMKVREYETRYKSLLHWLQVVAKSCQQDVRKAQEKAGQGISKGCYS
ncbi:hypothetical protein BC830DRAFT_678926 [Chytriomyces sp. MP71]|nr:hypothetical protein BC830DRAFT_678926 [Chytriomyces sp. MP71]